MQIYHIDSLPSTQDTVKDYMAEGYPLPFVVQADEQTGGRGRSGHHWISPKGNLYASFAIPMMTDNTRHAGQYSFLTAVALMTTLNKLGVTDAQNKWPNDILVNGKKIAGILLETHLPYGLIIGMGVNLIGSPEGATHIQAETQQAIAPIEFLQHFIPEFENLYQTYQENGFTPIRKAWLDKAYGIGMPINVRLPRETFTGVFIGLDEDGALLVETKAETRKIYSGDVFFA